MRFHFTPRTLSDVKPIYPKALMRNRAKCKLCQDVIESMHSTDIQICKCGEIGVEGGSAFYCRAKNWENFLRLDDEGNEKAVTIKEGVLEHIPESKPTKDDLIDMLDEMVKTYEALPQNAMTSPVTHYDVLSVLLVVSALFKAEA